MFWTKNLTDNPNKTIIYGSVRSEWSVFLQRVLIPFYVQILLFFTARNKVGARLYFHRRL